MDQGFLERMVAKLVSTEDIQKVYGYLKSYMERRLYLGNKS